MRTLPLQTAVLTATAIMLLPSPATAQDTNGAFAIEEVIVSANRREENIQEVPMSVTSLSGDFFKEAGITDFSKIDQYTPSLKITPGTDSRSTSIRIRGIGSVGTNTGIDPSVGLFIDGVYQGRTGMSVSDLIDIKRVEILRGPQGTLYGKNTAAGAISIITEKPSSEFSTQIETSYNSQAQMELRGVANFPFGNSGHATRLAVFSVLGEHLYDNEYKAENVQKEFNNADKWGLRSRTLFDFDDSGELFITIDYTKENTDCCVFAIKSFEGVSALAAPITDNPSAEWAIEYAPNMPYTAFENTESQGSPPAPDPFGDDYWVDAEIANKVDVGGIGLEWNTELSNGHTMTFINAWRQYESVSSYDGDFTAYNAVTGTTDVELKQASSELRIASPGGESFDYQAGLYVYHATLDSIGTFGVFTPLLSKMGLDILYPDNITNIDSNEFSTSSFALFGQTTWNISEKWSTTLGLRWTSEKKERDSSQVTEGFYTGGSCDYAIDFPPVTGPCITLEETRKDIDLSPSLTIRFFPAEDLMTYASASRGFKSGGFDQRRVPEGDNGEFEEEIATSYEIGWKGSWLDRRLQFNGALYFVEYDDFQSQTFNGSSIQVTNAGSMESYGVELELMLLLSQKVMLGSAIGYNKAEYKEFDNAQCPIEMAARQYYDNGGGVFPGAGNPPCTIDLKGEAVDNTPEWTISTFLQYSKPIGDKLEAITRLEHSYTDSYFLDQDLDENLKNDAVDLINLRFTLMSSNGGWETAAWVRNLLDEEYYAFGMDVPLLSGFAGIAAEERTYGVTLRLFWE